MKKSMILSLCLVALLVTGCGQVAKLKDGSEVVAEVNGKKITADDLYGEMKNTYARNVLIDMIDKTVLEKVYKTDDDMRTTINNQIDSYKEQLGANFMSTVKSQLGLNTEEEFSNYLLLNYKRNLAAKDYIKTIITDAEIQTYYDTKTVGNIKASHILIKPDTTDDMTATEKTAKETEAEDLAKDIIKKLNDGEDFATLAKKYSDDGSASKGGDLGWFNKGAMVESFETAAYALKKGSYSKTPVKSDYGYHIILKTDEKAKPSLKDAKDDIISSITTDKLAEQNNTYTYQALIELRKKYKLNIQDSELKKQYDSYMNELLNQ